LADSFYLTWCFFYSLRKHNNIAHFVGEEKCQFVTFDTLLRLIEKDFVM
jgi:hypothetical protein